VRDADAPRTGTPAARLGELLHAGFPVPRGFVATVHAQAAFLAAKDATDTNDKTDAALPPDLADALRAAYDALADIGGPDLPVTVRASRSEAARSADDARSTATRRGAGPVLEAVRQCWLGAQRAGAGPVAVVVQRLVASEAAGLAFTADPATGDLGRVLVEARLGVADDGLDPLAPRDWFVVDKTTGAIVETQLAAKPSRAVPAEGGAGLVVEAVPADRALLPSLVPEEVMRLAAAATAIEEHAGGPQEVRFAYEWVRDQRRLRILGCAPLPMETV
jgi:pyruvate,water dikinase